MKFVGHLDVMRYFQKAMRRAAIPIAYSAGYSPHMVMSFANPLGVGVTSDGEYFDIELKERISSKAAIEQLNAVMVEGVLIVSCVGIADDQKTGMSIVAAADYISTVNTGNFPIDWGDKLALFMEQEEICIVKKTKKREKEVDIRPMIYQFAQQGEGIFMKLATGSVENLKPELVMQAFTRYLGVEPDGVSFTHHRLEVYSAGEEGQHSFKSLESLGKTIL